MYITCLIFDCTLLLLISVVSVSSPLFHENFHFSCHTLAPVCYGKNLAVNAAGLYFVVCVCLLHDKPETCRYALYCYRVHNKQDSWSLYILQCFAYGPLDNRNAHLKFFLCPTCCKLYVIYK